MEKILIVEDEPLVARMYQKSLENSGYEAVIAVGGEEGIEKARSENPDLILMDIMMPGMNGMDAIDKLKSDDQLRDIPVVVLSNLSGKYDAELAIKRGAEEYWVKKDVSPSTIPGKIKELLETGEDSEESE